VENFIEQTGLRIIHGEFVSQNTFPSDIAIALKGETT